MFYNNDTNENDLKIGLKNFRISSIGKNKCETNQLHVLS